MRFERRYHRRSKAEATNASLKSKYGEFFRSRKRHLQQREAGLRVIAHNVRRLIPYRIREEVNELLDQAAPQPIILKAENRRAPL